MATTSRTVAGKTRRDRVPLGDVADLAAGGAGRSAEHLDAAGRHRDEAEQGAQQRRLAGAVRSDDADHLSLAHREAEVLEDPMAIALDANPVEADDDGCDGRCRTHGSDPPRARAKARAFHRIRSR